MIASLYLDHFFDFGEDLFSITLPVLVVSQLIIFAVFIFVLIRRILDYEVVLKKKD